MLLKISYRYRYYLYQSFVLVCSVSCMCINLIIHLPWHRWSSQSLVVQGHSGCEEEMCTKIFSCGLDILSPATACLQPVTLRQRDMEKHLWSSSQSLWGNWFNKPKYFSLSRQDIILKIYNNSKQLGDDTIPFAIWDGVPDADQSAKGKSKLKSKGKSKLKSKPKKS